MFVRTVAALGEAVALDGRLQALARGAEEAVDGGAAVGLVLPGRAVSLTVTTHPANS